MSIPVIWQIQHSLCNHHYSCHHLAKRHLLSESTRLLPLTVHVHLPTRSNRIHFSKTTGSWMYKNHNLFLSWGLLKKTSRPYLLILGHAAEEGRTGGDQVHQIQSSVLGFTMQYRSSWFCSSQRDVRKSGRHTVGQLLYPGEKDKVPFSWITARSSAQDTTATVLFQPYEFWRYREHRIGLLCLVIRKHQIWEYIHQDLKCQKGWAGVKMDD